MMVKINDEYFYTVDSSSRSFTLYRKEMRERVIQRTKIKTGEVSEANVMIGYYNKLDSMVRSCVDDIVARKCNDGTITHISEYFAEYRKAVKELVAAINGDFKEHSKEE